MRESYNKLDAAKPLFMMLVMLSVSFAQSEMLKALQDYYLYAQQEDLDAYYGTMDLTDFNASTLAIRKEITQATWERFDTVSHQLSNVTETSEGDDGLIEYSLSATIRGPDGSGGTGELSFTESYTAYMTKVDGAWKVNTISQSDVFLATMESNFMESQGDVIETLNSETVENVLKTPVTSESAGTAAQTTNKTTTATTGQQTGTTGATDYGATAKGGLCFVTYLVPALGAAAAYRRFRK